MSLFAVSFEKNAAADDATHRTQVTSPMVSGTLPLDGGAMTAKSDGMSPVMNSAMFCERAKPVTHLVHDAEAHDGEHDREPDVVRLDDEKVGHGHEAADERTEDEERTATDPVGQHAEDGDQDNRGDVGDDGDPQVDVRVHLDAVRLLRGVGRSEDDDGRADDVRHAHDDGAEERAARRAE
jgi:hypothetical protein